jgi:hypothetical protein
MSGPVAKFLHVLLIHFRLGGLCILFGETSLWLLLFSCFRKLGEMYLALFPPAHARNDKIHGQRCSALMLGAQEGVGLAGSRITSALHVVAAPAGGG